MKEKIKKILGEEKEVIDKYKYTFILIIITTLISLFLYDDSDYEILLTTLILTSVMSFSLETFVKKLKFKIPCFIASLGISWLSSYLLYESTNTPRIPFLISGIYLSLAMITIYKLSKQTKDFSTYLIKIFGNHIVFAIASFIMQLGVLFITFAIYELLLPDSFEIFAKMEILYAGLFLAPGEILALTSTKREPLKLVKFLSCYLLLPIVLISVVVIYCYFIKILILTSMPSNEIFAIITILFVIAIPTYILIVSYQEHNFIKKILNILPYIFIPLVIMAMYSLGIRIYDYGITLSRYYGIMIIAVEIFFIAKSIKKRNYENLLLFGVLLTLITLVIPYMNCVSISKNSQLKRLVAIYPETKKYEELTKEEKSRVYDIYYYLVYSLESKEDLPKYLDTDKITHNYYDYRDEETKRIDYYNKDKTISVSGYSSLEVIELKGYNANVDDLTLEDLDNARVKEKLKSNLKEIITTGEVIDPVLYLDDEHVICIKELYISYEKETNKISYLNLNGYLLTK